MSAARTRKHGRDALLNEARHDFGNRLHVMCEQV